MENSPSGNLSQMRYLVPILSGGNALSAMREEKMGFQALQKVALLLPFDEATQLGKFIGHRVDIMIGHRRSRFLECD